MSLPAYPTGEYVLVERDPAITKMGDIELPYEQHRYPNSGTILMCGPDVKNRTTDPNGDQRLLCDGRRVIFGQHAGINITDSVSKDGKQYLLLREKEVISIIPTPVP